MDNYRYIFNDNVNETEFPTLSKFKQMDFENKETLNRYHMLNTLNKTLSMFEYEGLPEEIPQRIIELQIQVHGYTILFKHEGKIYASWGGLGGVPNYNYMPTKAIVANPYLNISKMFTINEDCVVIPNDKLYLGIMPTNRYYSSQLVENDISMNVLKTNARAMNILVAPDEDTKQSLEDVWEELKTGKVTSAIDKNIISDKLLSLPFASGGTSQTIVQLLEERQYVKGSLLNELGIQSNYNMKRETITSNENILNVDNLLPFSDNMLECRRIALKKVKEIFGLDISVDFSSSWKKLRKEIELKEREVADAGKVQSNGQNKNIDKVEINNEDNKE